MILKFIKSGYKKISSALGKTRSALTQTIKDLFSGKVDEETLESLEELFYEADLGVKTSVELVEKIRTLYKNNSSITADEVMEEIQKEILLILNKQSSSVRDLQLEGPTVFFIVGVNGNGKTTSAAKLAKRYKDAGKKVLLAAADTFRAAATEQLDMWAKKVGVDIVKGQHKSDPSAVVFDAVSAAKSRNCDVLIIDTAGRLHTKTDLMQELGKMKRVCSKIIPESPHEILLALDATTGQNAIDQAKIFNNYTPITGLILTKLDGTAKGGITVAIQRELGIPIKFIGTGEGIEDMEAFVAENFVSALFE
ncbi:MAG: fused signal recognition particle receptor [Chlamydiales bacterium]|jgi:fused signal recognition particle receptor